MNEIRTPFFPKTPFKNLTSNGSVPLVFDQEDILMMVKSQENKYYPGFYRLILSIFHNNMEIFNGIYSIQVKNHEEDVVNYGKPLLMAVQMGRHEMVKNILTRMSVDHFRYPTVIAKCLFVVEKQYPVDKYMIKLLLENEEHEVINKLCVISSGENQKQRSFASFLNSEKYQATMEYITTTHDLHARVIDGSNVTELYTLKNTF